MSEAGPPMPRWAETLAAVLLSIAGLTTAWASYQASLWGGEQVSHYGVAGGLLTNASQYDILAGQAAGIDTALFVAWTDAALRGDEARREFIERRFSPTFAAAFAEWRTQFPQNLKGYRLPPGITRVNAPKVSYPQAAKAAELRAQAAAIFQQGEAANSHSDKFVAVTVLLSTVLFLAGIAQLLHRTKPRLALLGLSGLLLVIALVWLFQIPAAAL
jgi:hypothetical protein